MLDLQSPKEMDDELRVQWRGEIVGKMTDLQPDMWYVDGKWTSESTSQSAEFEALTGEFDAKAVMGDPTKGTRITIIVPNDPEDSGTDALVYSLTDGRLFIRQIMGAEAVEWLRENVR